MVTVDVRNINPAVLERRMELAQKRLDNMVISDCEQYVPFKSGKLRESVHIHTVPGSGLIIYPGPYAHYQYEGKDMVGVSTKKHWADKYEPKEYNGKVLHYHEPGTEEKWFEKAKEQNIDKWMNMVRRTINGS